MNKKLKIFGIISLLVMVVVLVLPVFASGDTVTTLYLATESSGGYLKRTYSDYWSAVINKDDGWAVNIDSEYDEVMAGFAAGGMENKWHPRIGVMAFDLSEIPEDIEVVDAYIELYITEVQTGWLADGEVGYFAFFAGAPESAGAGWTQYDGDNAIDAGSIRLTGFERHDQLEINEYNRFTLLPDYYDYIITPNWNDRIAMYFSSFHMQYDYAPEWVTDNTRIWVFWNDYNSAHKPRLVLTYIADTPEREIVTEDNAAVDETISGLEVADNITWESPRAGYADEGMYFKCNGESGASILLQLKDEPGNVLDTVTDTIRVDGNYDWVVDVPDSWYGWIRVIELNHGLASDWGYQMPKPDADQLANTAYAINTEHPQYDFPFSRYIKYENDIGVIHWKTNVQVGESANHTLQIWGNGDNTTGVYLDKTLEWLNDNYWHANEDNEFLSAWRYFIFTPNIEGGGYEDYDGMIYDLDVNYSVVVAGFLQALIYNESDNSTLADSHSCYWYLPSEQDGFIFLLDSDLYRTGSNIKVTLQIGEACQAREYLPSLKLSIINESGAEISSKYEGYRYGLNQYIIEAPTTSGNYEVRFTFAGDGTWDYIHDEPFAVTTAPPLTSATDFLDKINIQIENWGMNNPMGHWMIILVIAIVLFVIFIKSPALRVFMPLMAIAGGMIAGWIDAWIIILLALGVGFYLWRTVRGRTADG